MKVLHVLSEAKFVDLHISKFRHSNFTNKFVYLNAKFDYSGKNLSLLEYYPTTDSGYSDLIVTLPEYDLIILYFLNIDKLALLSKLQPPYSKILWSFYGAELYNLPSINHQFLSKETKSFLYKSSFKAFVRAFKTWLRPSWRKLKGKPSLESSLLCQLDKIHSFIWYNKFEYTFLNDLLHHQLPPFFEASVSHIIPKQEKKKKDGVKILVGNSGSYYNNHADVLKLLNKCQFDKDVTIPMSYGATEEYKKYIKGIIKNGLYNTNILEKMISYEDNLLLLNEQSAAVFPSYRQMALGNIVIGIQCNLKIYLSKQNPTYAWLKSNKIKVFSIEGQLKNDIINGDLILSEEEMDYNRKAYFEIANAKNDERYFQQLSLLASR